MAASESEAGATCYCKNCKRDIPEQNFQMHEIHCQRNLRLCAKCDEAIPRSEMEDHMAEFHALVECKCKLKIEKAQLEKHEKEDCLMRMVPCKFCEVSLKFGDMPDHENACGSRTEKCEKCGNYIMIKFSMTHDCSASKPKQGIPPYPVLPNIGYDFQTSANGADYSSFIDDFCMQSHFQKSSAEEPSSSISDDLPIHGRRRVKHDIKGKNKDHFAKKEPARNAEFGDHVAADMQGLNIEGRNIPTKVVRVGDRQKKVDRSNRRVRPNVDQVTDATRTRKGKVATDSSFNMDVNSQNGLQREVIPRGRSTHSRDLPRHKVVADGRRRFELPRGEDSDTASVGANNRLASFTESSNGARPRGSAEQIIPINVEDEPEEFSSISVARDDNIGIDITSGLDESFQIPCEICDALVSAHELELHQENCLVEQQKALRTFDTGVSTNVEKTENVEPIVIDEKSEADDEPFIPCEFCEEAFPVSSVILHQPFCNMNPQRHDMDDDITILNNTSDPTSLPNGTPDFWQSRLDPLRLPNEQIGREDPFQIINSLSDDFSLTRDTRFPQWGTTSQPFGGADEDDVMADDIVTNEGEDDPVTSTRRRGWPYDEL
ncbi:uncharacterized protein LOC135683718 isoform X2 [Rhopilema esculentum]|uniref:uncharacterized protein LOC135683718 isoform X2 n=1 Tax=Rhopilema esculentum TaxID=499914 RepID=UPI0031E1685D